MDTEDQSPSRTTLHKQKTPKSSFVNAPNFGELDNSKFLGSEMINDDDDDLITPDEKEFLENMSWDTSSDENDYLQE